MRPAGQTHALVSSRAAARRTPPSLYLRFSPPASSRRLSHCLFLRPVFIAMAKLTQKTVAAFFSPRRKRTTRVNRKLKEAEPVFSDDSSSEDDPAHFALEPKSRASKSPRGARYRAI